MGQNETEAAPAAAVPDARTELPNWRKGIILFVVSWMTLAVTYSSTCLFPAAPEIAQEFGSTVEKINISNAGVLLAMGSSSLIWGPITTTIGRRAAHNASIVVLFACSLGTALSINMPMFTAMRVLAGFEGTFQMVIGQTIIADIFDQKFRGTAIGLFMVGSVAGPALGPCVGGVIVTYCSWRVVFWVQTGMVGLGLALSLLFVPTISQPGRALSKPSLRVWAREQVDMMQMFVKLLYPNVFLSDLTCGCLAWSQYSLLAAVRALINPRFHLTSPLVSGLFYLAPGAGFFLGSVCGGKFSDMTMTKRIRMRGGERFPQDRLYSGRISFFAIIPVASMIYGWCLQYEFGGLALPIVAAFFVGFGLMAAFSSLNTYCGEAIPEQRIKIIASKYFIQYIFGAAGNAAIVPLIDGVGVGIASTIGVILVLAGGCLVLVVARWGRSMQDWVDVRIFHPKKT